LSPHAKGLDFGCGPGPAIATMLETAGHSVANYDPIYAPDQRLLNNQYDFIVCTEVAEHFHRPAEAFQQLHGMLAKNGILAVMTGWLDEGVDFPRWHYRRDPTHVCFYQKATFEWLARQQDYTVVLLEKNVALLQRSNPEFT